jgi:hypothetical protein
MCHNPKASAIAVVAAVVSLTLQPHAVAAECKVPTTVVLKFPACRAVPKNPSVRIVGVTIDAAEFPEIREAKGYLIAQNAPPFDPAVETISVMADGVPIYCGGKGEAKDLPAIGCAGVYTMDCSNSWLLEVGITPASAFKYVRHLAAPTSAECVGLNKTKTVTQLFDVSPDETVRVFMNDLGGALLHPFDVNLDQIQKKGKNGKVTLRGRQILLGDTAPAAIESTKTERDAVARRLNGLEEVCFVKK